MGFSFSQYDDCKLIVGDGPFTIYVQPEDGECQYEAVLVMETEEGELYFGCELGDLQSLYDLTKPSSKLGGLIAWDEFKNTKPANAAEGE